MSKIQSYMRKSVLKYDLKTIPYKNIFFLQVKNYIKALPIMLQYGVPLEFTIFSTRTTAEEKLHLNTLSKIRYTQRTFKKILQ
jgi:hypothetical protein